MNSVAKELLQEVAGFHSIPQGAFNIRENGKLVDRKNIDGIEIVTKKEQQGIDIIIKNNTKNQSVHLPVIITKSGIDDLVYNDFYIGDNCDILIVAGCGIHAEKGKSSHNGIHTFHIGKNSKVKYVEKHMGLGNAEEKILNPVTKINLGKGSELVMETTQIKGVTFSNRKTNALVGEDAKLIIKEKILTTENQKANSDFKVALNGNDSKCEVVSRVVAKDNSCQNFKSTVIGNKSCYGRVECDGILVGNAKIKSTPTVSANNIDANLTHEASIGKIAGDELVKLMTLGLTEKEAESFIIKGFLK
ncbi:MAG: SufD family Fe-S cluster assembly protein [Clostridia bacterium]|nr:SufD family Fe-S cluster assembly protein [Clostridia bacterium]